MQFQVCIFKVTSTQRARGIQKIHLATDDVQCFQNEITKANLHHCDSCV